MKAHVILLLIAAILSGMMAAGNTARATVYPVPSEHEDISDALTYATSGDTVLVWESDEFNTPYQDSFTITSGVKVLAEGEEEPIIDGGSLGTYAVDFASGASSSTILEGFTITGGTYGAVRVRGSGVLRDCTIENASAGVNDIGVQSEGSTTIEDCDISISGDESHTGIVHSGGAVDITSCNVSVSDGMGISVDTGSGATGGEVTNCTITMNDNNNGVGLALADGAYTISDVSIVFEQGGYDNIGIRAWGSVGNANYKVSDCFVSVPTGVGVWVSGEESTLERITIDDCGTGFYNYDASDPVVYNCVVTNYNDGSEYAFQHVEGIYCIADGSDPYDTGTQGTGSVNEDPLYCDATNEEYTLRVDSYGNPENNARGEQIGAFGVECMYGTLIRDATFAGSGTLAMMDSVIVPAGKKLTLGKDTVVNVDAFYPPVPLRVYGTLHVNGEDGDEVVLQSSESLEGYWQGIRTEDDAKVRLEYAVINHAVYGVHTNGCDSVEVRNCTFASNSNHDIRLTSVQASAGSYAVIEDNVISVGGGSGINLIDHSSGVTLSGNTITGDESSTAGIISGNMFSDTLTIEGNTIEGFSNGSGVWLDCGTPTFVGNTIQDSKYGFTILGGAPKIGTSSSSSDNTITGNTTGIQHDAAAATAVILNNQINSNTFGVVNKSGDPNLGGRDGVGNGNNTLTNNSTYCLWNRSRSNADTIWAHGNYYGACSGGLPPTCWSGIVNVTSPLCTAPSAVIADIIEVTGEARGFRLLGAWPNPMTASNEITFSLKEGTAHVGVQIFDVAGRLVRDIPAVDYGPGVHAVHWDGRNRLGAPVQGGIYFIRVAGTAGLNATAKVLVAR